MELTIYEVLLDIELDQYDRGWETQYQDAFPTKRSAIRVCQSMFDKQPINDYVKSVNAAVYKVVITDNGRETGTRIYNKYKSR